MSLAMQYIVIAIAVLAAGAYVGRQIWNTLAGRRSRLGSCCDKGCGAEQKSTAAPAEKIQFLPLEMLGKSKK
jgi:hypothetical protein